MKKKHFNDEIIEDLIPESRILSEIDHPFIVKIFNQYESPNYFSVIFEECKGGDIIDTVKKTDGFRERRAAEHTKQLLSAVIYMHDRNIVHRDIKAENVLLETKKIDSGIRLIDFGYATYHHPKADNFE